MTLTCAAEFMSSVAAVDLEVSPMRSLPPEMISFEFWPCTFV